MISYFLRNWLESWFSQKFLKRKVWILEKKIDKKTLFQIFALQKNVDDTKVVNKEIASTLESVMASHSQLQKVVEEIQLQLGKKDAQISHLKNEKWVFWRTPLPNQAE